MKKINLLITSCLAATTLFAQPTDYSKGLSIWFDKPTNLENHASWYSPKSDINWENNSLPIGNVTS